MRKIVQRNKLTLGVHSHGGLPADAALFNARPGGFAVAALIEAEYSQIVQQIRPLTRVSAWRFWHNKLRFHQQSLGFFISSSSLQRIFAAVPHNSQIRFAAAVCVDCQCLRSVLIAPLRSPV